MAAGGSRTSISPAAFAELRCWYCIKNALDAALVRGRTVQAAYAGRQRRVVRGVPEAPPAAELPSCRPSSATVHLLRLLPQQTMQRLLTRVGALRARDFGRRCPIFVRESALRTLTHLAYEPCAGGHCSLHASGCSVESTIFRGPGAVRSSCFDVYRTEAREQGISDLSKP